MEGHSSRKRSSHVRHFTRSDDNHQSHLMCLVWRRPRRMRPVGPAGTTRTLALCCKQACSSNDATTRAGHWSSTLLVREELWPWQHVAGNAPFPLTTCRQLQLRARQGVCGHGDRRVRGYRRSFTRRAASRAARSTSAQRGRGTPLRRNTETRGRINSELGSMEELQPVNQDFHAPFVDVVWHGDIHILDPNVGCHPPSSFPAHTCRC